MVHPQESHIGYTDKSHSFAPSSPQGVAIKMERMFRLTSNRVHTEPAPRLYRQHRATLRQLDRGALERAGWRTTLEFRENHVRSEDGCLLKVETVWVAEAERGQDSIGDLDVLSVTARSESRAWAQLLTEATRAGQGRTLRREPGRIEAAG